MALPRLPYRDNIRKHTLTRFGGYMHTAACSEGEIYDMKNMSSRAYPSIRTRERRQERSSPVQNPQGLFSWDGLYIASGTSLYKDDGTAVGSVTNTRKQFAALGAYIIIMPDKKYYNTKTGAFGTLYKKYIGAAGAISFSDGTLYGEPAEGCCLKTTGAAFDFNVGDAVTISGCVTHPENNKTPIIREISADKKTLIFSEHSLEVGSESGSVTVERAVPDMDYICVNENRVWGCKGDTIYASKLGDIFNYNVFDGIASDSFAVDVGSDGEFTACASFLGYPVFFKDNYIYKVYGSKPSDYQVMGAARAGVKAGCAASLAVAGETLYYLSHQGIMMYTGALPRPISEPFGGEIYSDAVAGSDGLKYYVSMRDTDGAYHLFVYDSQRGMWHREDDTEAVAFAFVSASGVYKPGLFCLTSGGKLRKLTGETESSMVTEEYFPWSVEFGEFYMEDPNRKGISKVQIRLESEELATVIVEIKYNSQDWEQIYDTDIARIGSFYIPVVPRRCDHFTLRLSGIRDVRIQSLVTECYSGSEMF